MALPFPAYASLCTLFREVYDESLPLVAAPASPLDGLCLVESELGFTLECLWGMTEESLSVTAPAPGPGQEGEAAPYLLVVDRQERPATYGEVEEALRSFQKRFLGASA